MVLKCPSRFSFIQVILIHKGLGKTLPITIFQYIHNITEQYESCLPVCLDVEMYVQQCFKCTFQVCNHLELKTEMLLDVLEFYVSKENTILKYLN